MSQAPISLYIALREGESADLEVVARASIAFASAIKEAAYVLDPSARVRVELASGTEGSLSLNSFVKLVSQNTKLDKQTVHTIVIVSALWLAKEVGSWTVGKVMDFIAKQPSEITRQLTQQEIESIAESVVVVMGRKTGGRQFKQVYEELEKDQSITGVGASLDPGIAPSELVPRAEFQSRANEPEVVEQEIRTRETTKRERVIVVKPVLRLGDGRWRFSLEGSTLGAPIKDQEFLARLLSGNILIPMRAGIEMDVDLKRTEEFDGEAWQIVGWEVLKVHDVYTPDAGQGNLFAPPSDDKGNSTEDDDQP